MRSMRSVSLLIVCRVIAIGCRRSFHIAQSGLELLELHGFEALAHDPEAIADTRADLAIKPAIRHRPNCLGQPAGYLREIP
jgi:hypothetical protein